MSDVSVCASVFYHVHQVPKRHSAAVVVISVYSATWQAWQQKILIILRGVIRCHGVSSGGMKVAEMRLSWGEELQ